MLKAVIEDFVQDFVGLFLIFAASSFLPKKNWWDKFFIIFIEIFIVKNKRKLRKNILQKKITEKN